MWDILYFPRPAKTVICIEKDWWLIGFLSSRVPSSVGMVKCRFFKECLHSLGPQEDNSVLWGFNVEPSTTYFLLFPHSPNPWEPFFTTIPLPSLFHSSRAGAHLQLIACTFRVLPLSSLQTELWTPRYEIYSQHLCLQGGTSSLGKYSIYIPFLKYLLAVLCDLQRWFCWFLSVYFPSYMENEALSCFSHAVGKD